jgi:tetratricopeptide (TPR) repeat protein
MNFFSPRLLTLCLLTSLVSLPLDFVSDTKAFATDEGIQLAQASSVQQLLQRGYDLTAQKQYHQALKYFRQALQVSPGNRYAIGAIRNVESYIRRDRQQKPSRPSVVSKQKPSVAPVVSRGSTFSFNQYMQLGYRYTTMRNYRQALKYFEKALQIRPSNQYATDAIRNVTGYIQRRQAAIFYPGKPNRRGSATVRGVDIELMPTRYSLITEEEYPVLSVYVPNSAKTAKQLKLVLQEGNGRNARIVYEQTFEEFQTDSTMLIPLPDNQQPLSIDTEYTWTFSVIYPSEWDVPNEYQVGRIKRVVDQKLVQQTQ